MMNWVEMQDGRWSVEVTQIKQTIACEGKKKTYTTSVQIDRVGEVNDFTCWLSQSVKTEVEHASSEFSVTAVYLGGAHSFKDADKICAPHVKAFVEVAS